MARVSGSSYTGINKLTVNKTIGYKKGRGGGMLKKRDRSHVLNLVRVFTHSVNAQTVHPISKRMHVDDEIKEGPPLLVAIFGIPNISSSRT